jgi:molecular chaperone GrpE
MEEKQTNTEELSKIMESNPENDNNNDLITEETLDELSELHTQVQALQDKLLRSMAETENVRARLNKNVEEAREYSIIHFAKDLIPVIDNLTRAIEHAPKIPEGEISSLLEGIKMTQKELENAFVKHGLESIEPQEGEKFDYNAHHAIAQVVTDKQKEGTIVGTMQIGYRIKERLIRPASVTVAKN